MYVIHSIFCSLRVFDNGKHICEFHYIYYIKIRMKFTKIKQFTKIGAKVKNLDRPLAFNFVLINMIQLSWHNVLVNTIWKILYYLQNQSKFLFSFFHLNYIKPVNLHDMTIMCNSQNYVFTKLIYPLKIIL